MTGLDIDVDMLLNAGGSIDELNIANWKKPENKYQGYKDAVSYAVTKDREAREQAIEDSRAKLWEKLTPQQRALLDAVAQQATGNGMLELKDGVDAHLEGLADTWAKHAGALLDSVVDAPEYDTVSTGQVEMQVSDTSRDWDIPPHQVDEEVGHRLTDINEEYRRAHCAAHGYRVRIEIMNSRPGQKVYWRCGERDTYRKQERAQSRRKDK